MMYADGGSFTTPEEMWMVGARSGQKYALIGEDPDRPFVNPPKPERVDITPMKGRPVRRMASGGAMAVGTGRATGLSGDNHGPASGVYGGSRGAMADIPAAPPMGDKADPAIRQPRMESYRLGNTTYIAPRDPFGRPSLFTQNSAEQSSAPAASPHSFQRADRAGNAIRRFMRAPKSATIRHVGTGG